MANSEIAPASIFRIMPKKLRELSIFIYPGGLMGLLYGGGPYFMTPDDDAPFSLLNGHSMIVDYRGYNPCKISHQNEAAVPGEINIKALREYRATSPHAGHIAQMRPGLWKQIYEKWPDFPKNRYAEKTYDHILERHVLLQESVEKMLDQGIFTRPEPEK